MIILGRLLGASALLLALGANAQAAEKIRGFSDEAAAAQLALEASFDASVTPANLDQWMKYLTARPRHTGAPYTRETVDWMAAQFRSWGYEVEIEVFHVLYPTPKLRLVEMVAPTRFTAKLEEPVFAEDATSGQKAEQLPIFNAFSPDGDVTADVVFVNQGIPQDYEDLARMGISVEGKLVMARYGGSWRGIKPKVAQEHGALAVILYSDPEDDGYRQGLDYPEGPYRPAAGAQRGSVLDLPMRPGDPLTPYRGATEDAERLAIEDAETLLKIPVLPISYEDALPILSALEGPVAPARWQGALPITYRVGPGPARVHLKLEFNWDLAPAYDLIARLEGAEFPDQWVMRGNHHDAWVNGAADPISGLVAMMEEARIIGELAKAGQRPKRTILYGAWDAEEPALLGSTEWVEHHADELREKLVAYINTDGTGRGFLSAGGSHTLEAMFDEIADAVDDPNKGISVKARSKARARVNANGEARKLADSDTFFLSALGSGSDYSGFLQHLGIASFNLGFGGESGGGSYHSVFDSYDHYTRFVDGEFVYGATLAKVAGRTTLRLANAEILPFEFSRFLATVERYRDDVKEQADTLREDTARHNALLAHGAYAAAFDPAKPYALPEAKPPLPHFNFAPLDNALAGLASSVARLNHAQGAQERSGNALSAADMEAFNTLAFRSERDFILPGGLPRRPWFRHAIYAPGFYTGYGVKTLPGIREAIEERFDDEVAPQMERIAEAISRLALRLDKMTEILAEAIE